MDRIPALRTARPTLARPPPRPRARRLPALRAAVVALALAFVAPAASAQDAQELAEDREASMITFYGHVFGIGRGQPMPMNTEFPDGEADLSAGFSGDNCGVFPVEDPTGQVGGSPSCEDSPTDEVWLYTTAGFVDVADRFEFDYAKVHNERGLTKDFVLDTTKSVTATFYMSADVHGWLFLISDPNGQGVPADPEDVPWPGPAWNWDPGVLPKWQVKATLYAAVLGEYGGEANTAPPIADAVDAGTLEVIAEGLSEPIDVTSLEAAGSPTVWQFDIDLGAPKTSVIPKEKSLLVRFQWWSTALGGKHIVPELMSWNVNSGEFYPTRVTVPVKNAFDVELVVPRFIHDKLLVLGLLNTPWGSYDVDHDSVRMTVARASNGQEVVPERVHRLADFSVAHGGHYKPVNVTWVWDYQRDRLAPGEYVVTVSASNHQHSASAACSARFTVLDGGAPGDTTLGECGVVTGSEEQVERATRDAAGAATAAALPSTGLSVLAAGAVLPAPTLGGPLALLAFAASVLLARRWAP